MNEKSMTAVKLRLILIGALSLIVLAHIGIPLLGQHLLRQNSTSVTQAISHETSSRETLERLEKAEQQLKTQKNTVEKSKNLYADAAAHNYQRQVIEQVNAYASMVGVGVTGYSFSDSTSGEGAAGAGASAPAAPTPAAATAPAAGASAASPTGVTGAKTTTVTVSLQSPIEYATFLKFIKLLQGNVTQFQLQTINFSGGGSSTNTAGAPASASPSGGATTIAIPTITMEVYIKQ